MKETSNHASGGSLPASDAGGIEQRIFRTMAVAVAVAVLGSLPLGEWRVTLGLLLGGLLSLLNHHWLKSSTAAAFSVVAHGAKPKLAPGAIHSALSRHRRSRLSCVQIEYRLARGHHRRVVQFCGGVVCGGGSRVLSGNHSPRGN